MTVRMLKSFLILGALAAGLLLPQLDDYTFVLRPFLMLLLFFSFLNVRLDREMFAWQQVAVAALLPAFGLGVYWLGGWYDDNLALTLLLMGVAPTAAITPVLAEVMNRSAAYMIGSILVTSAIFALAMPLLLPWLLGVDLSLASLGLLMYTIGSTILIPMLAAQVARRIGGRLLATLRWIGPYIFVAFLCNVAVAAGSLSHYLQYESTTPWTFVGITAVAISVLMLVKFTIGSYLAPPNQTIEGSLALGRKNTMLSIWIADLYPGTEYVCRRTDLVGCPTG